MTQRQNVRTGKIGEYLTASSLESLGVKCDIVSQEGFDILAYTNGIIIRVQVKSTACARLNSPKEKQKKYIFLCAKSAKKIMLTEDDCDVIALVAVDLKKVLYIPVTSLMGVTYRVLPQDFDNVNLESESWNECLKSIAESSALRNNGRGRKPERDRELSSCDDAGD